MLVNYKQNGIISTNLNLVWDGSVKLFIQEDINNNNTIYNQRKVKTFRIIILILKIAIFKSEQDY